MQREWTEIEHFQNTVDPFSVNSRIGSRRIMETWTFSNLFENSFRQFSISFLKTYPLPSSRILFPLLLFLHFHVFVSIHVSLYLIFLVVLPLVRSVCSSLCPKDFECSPHLPISLNMPGKWNKLFISQTTFARDGSVLFRNEMKPFYWSIFWLTSFLTNRMASFRFGTIWNRNV